MVSSFVLLVVGIVLITTHWKGSVSMGFGYPLSGGSLQMNVTDQGTSVIIGVASIAAGTVVFAVTFVESVINLAIGRGR